jgi:hypothetical protein
VIVWPPAAEAVNVSWQEAIPVVPVVASAQLPELPNEPVVGDEAKLTVPVGVLAPLEAVSVTVAVHVEGAPVVTDEGEHATLVDVGAGFVNTYAAPSSLKAGAPTTSVLPEIAS